MHPLVELTGQIFNPFETPRSNENGYEPEDCEQPDRVSEGEKKPRLHGVAYFGNGS